MTMATTALNRRQAIIAHGDAHSLLTHKDLDLSTIQKSFDQAKAAYATRQYRVAIDSVTIALNILQTIVMPTLLLHRAAAYEMAHEYDLALTDCQTANKDDRTKAIPDAYLGAASALVFQNKLNKAAQVYQEGINAVPKTHCKHAELVKRHDQVVREMDTRNQWLAQLLPLEVLHRVLSLVTVQDRTRLSQTCRYWHRFIRDQWPDLWYELDATEINFTLKAPVVQQFLQDKAQEKVRRLKLDMQGYNMSEALRDSKRDVQAFIRWPSRIVIHFILRQNWSHIESLELLNWDQDLLLRILEASKNTIKTIKLNGYAYESERHSARVASDLMQRYPNLQTITINAPTSVQWEEEEFMPSITLPQGVYLTQLAISGDVDPEHLINLLDDSPGLQSLEIDCDMQFTEPNVLEIVDKHCHRSLRALLYRPTEHTGRFIASYSRSEPDNRPSFSLQNLELLGYPILEKDYPMTSTSTRQYDQALIPILQKSHETLKTLRVDLAVISSSEHQWIQTLSRLGAPQIQVLDLRENDSRTFGPEELISLIKACPSLLNVSLDGGTFWHDQVFHALVRCGDLQELSISHDGYMPETNATLEMDRQGIISVDGLKALFTRTKNLKRFAFNYYHRESSHNTYRIDTPRPQSQAFQLTRRPARTIHRHSGRRMSYVKRHGHLSNYVVDTVREPNNLSMDVLIGLADGIVAAPNIEELCLDCMRPNMEMDAVIQRLGNSQIRRLDFNIYKYNKGIDRKYIDAFASLPNLECLRLYSKEIDRNQKRALIKILKKSTTANHLSVILRNYSGDGLKGCRPTGLSKVPANLEILYNIQDLKPKIKKIWRNYEEERDDEEEEVEWWNTGEKYLTCPTCNQMSHYSNFDIM